MKKNLLVVLILALIATPGAFGQTPCQGTWSATWNGTAWVGTFTPAATGEGNCYLATPTYNNTNNTVATVISNTYSWVWQVTPTNTLITTNPYYNTSGSTSGTPYATSVFNTLTNTWVLQTGGNIVFNGYGIPQNGIGGPNYGTGQYGNAITPLGPLSNGYFTTVYVLNGQIVAKGTAGNVAVTVPAGAVAWSGQAYDRSNGAAMDVLGGHGASSGCMNCHTPHNSGRVDATSPAMYNSTLGNVYSVVNGVATVIGNYYTNAAAGPFSPYAPTNTPAFVWQDAGYGQQLGSTMNPYLWNHALAQVTYTTWDGVASAVTANGGSVATISQAMLSTGKEPVVHTLLCLSCHDNSMNSHGMTNQTTVKNGTYVTGYTNGQLGEPGAVGGTISGGNVVWGSGSLAANHPVHAVYPADGGIADYGFAYYWMVTPASNGTVTFVDNDTNQIGDSGFYGHPARLYSDGTTAWVECTSCHNPHRQTSPAWLNKSGKYTVGAYGTTTYYIRGPFSTLDGTIASGFCRSCHYGKSPEYVANAGASK